SPRELSPPCWLPLFVELCAAVTRSMGVVYRTTHEHLKFIYGPATLLVPSWIPAGPVPATRVSPSAHPPALQLTVVRCGGSPGHPRFARDPLRRATRRAEHVLFAQCSPHNLASKWSCRYSSVRRVFNDD